MPDLSNDTQSLSHFKRNTAEVMKQIKKTGEPLVLTVNGKPEVVVQDAAAYQRLLGLVEKAEMIEFLRESKADADAGRTLPAREFLESLGKKKTGERDMTFRVEIARKAAREIEDHYDWLAERSQAAADRWRDSLLSAIDSLGLRPDRCAEAAEAEWYGPELRELIHRKRKRIHRILFEIRGDTVVILRVRHGAQAPLGPDDL